MRSLLDVGAVSPVCSEATHDGLIAPCIYGGVHHLMSNPASIVGVARRNRSQFFIFSAPICAYLCFSVFYPPALLVETGTCKYAWGLILLGGLLFSFVDSRP